FRSVEGRISNPCDWKLRIKGTGPRLPLPAGEFPVASKEAVRGNDDSVTEISSRPSSPVKVSMRRFPSSDVSIVVHVLGTETQKRLITTGRTAEIRSER